jgi:hypothetical protein
MKTQKYFVLGLLGGAGYIVLRFGFSFSPELSLLISVATVTIGLIAKRFVFGSANKRNSS